VGEVLPAVQANNAQIDEVRKGEEGEEGGGDEKQTAASPCTTLPLPLPLPSDPGQAES
jgi:hypothetical protein